MLSGKSQIKKIVVRNSLYKILENANEAAVTGSRLVVAWGRDEGGKNWFQRNTKEQVMNVFTALIVVIVLLVICEGVLKRLMEHVY